eukprot:7895839-Pyramimonas_sp.AAC.2
MTRTRPSHDFVDTVGVTRRRKYRRGASIYRPCRFRHALNWNLLSSPHTRTRTTSTDLRRRGRRSGEEDP